MKLRISCPDGLSDHARITLEDGTEITGVIFAGVSLEPGQPARAVLSFELCDLDLQDLHVAGACPSCGSIDYEEHEKRYQGKTEAWAECGECGTNGPLSAWQLVIERAKKRVARAS